MDGVRRLVAQGDAGLRGVIHGKGVKLPGKVRLQKRERQDDQHNEDEGQRQLVLAEGAEGAAPVGVVGVAGALDLLGVELGELKGLRLVQGRLEVFAALALERFELGMLDDAHVTGFLLSSRS